MLMARDAIAQPHYNTWFRGTISVPAGKKIVLDAEWQHRRQSGFANSNMLSRNLMCSFRNWIHYKHNKRITFSLSPFASFYNYRIIQKRSDEATVPVREIRLSGAVAFQNQLTSDLSFITRAAIEYRIPENDPNIIRVRERLGLRYAFSSRGNLTLFDELLVNMTGTATSHFFDHNRIGADIEYEPWPDIKIDLGYMYITRLPLANTNILQEHNIFLNLSVHWLSR